MAILELSSCCFKSWWLFFSTCGAQVEDSWKLSMLWTINCFELDICKESDSVYKISLNDSLVNQPDLIITCSVILLTAYCWGTCISVLHNKPSCYIRRIVFDIYIYCILLKLRILVPIISWKRASSKWIKTYGFMFHERKQVILV